MLITAEFFRNVFKHRALWVEDKAEVFNSKRFNILGNGQADGESTQLLLDRPRTRTGMIHCVLVRPLFNF